MVNSSGFPLNRLTTVPTSNRARSLTTLNPFAPPPPPATSPARMDMKPSTPTVNPRRTLVPFLPAAGALLERRNVTDSAAVSLTAAVPPPLPPVVVAPTPRFAPAV